MTTLPAWLAARPPATGPLPTGRAVLRDAFVDRTLLRAAAFARDSLEAGQTAERPGVLQGLDARAKVLAALLLLVGIALSRSLFAIGAVAALALTLAAASRVDVGRFARRVWLVVPLFTLAAALPATLNVTTPGDPLLVLGRVPDALVRLGWPETLAVTGTGLIVAARLVLRVGASLSIVMLVAETTPHNEALGALRSLGVPRAFVLVATMMQRYLLALVLAVEELHLGLVSRRLRPLSPTAGRAFVATRLGVLLRKARTTAEEVHLAMVARGFRGEVRTLAPARLRVADGALVLAAALAATAVALAARGGVV